MVLQTWERGVSIKWPTGSEPDRPRGDRKKITEFTERASKALGWAYSQGPWQGMVTLTYADPQPVPQEEFSKHRHNFLKHLQRQGIAYLWVLEWQKRGTPHLHVWVDQYLTDGRWQKAMEHWLKLIGESDNPKARKVALHPMTWCPWDVRAGNNYASKYGQKRSQKGLPVGIDSYGRWWGVTRGIIKPRTSSDVGEEVVNQTTGEVHRATTVSRQCIHALRHWFPNLKKHKKSSRKGFSRALQESKHAAILRILSFYTGDVRIESQITQIQLRGNRPTNHPQQLARN